MSRLLLAAALLAVVAGAAHAAPAQKKIAVKVVEIAGERAYLEPGAAAGLRPGQVVTIRGKKWRVVDVTDGHAAVELAAGGGLAEGDKGSAMVAAEPAPPAPLPAPTPLDRFAGKWPDARHPADTQTPRRVPLGRARPPGAMRLAVVERGMIIWPVGEDAPGPVVTLELGARASFTPWRERPLALDADVSALVWLGEGLGGPDATHPAVRVRELRLRWGGPYQPRAAVGRLRWAAASVGLLDGARVGLPVGGGVSIAAFGGLVPDAIDGRPSTDAARFGVELAIDRPRSPWQPRATLTVHGSTWMGSLDERRLSVTAAVTRGPLDLSGYAEVSSFPADTPWGGEPVELTAGGADVALGGPRLHATLHVGMRQPERSRFLLAALPQGYVCTAAPQAPGTPEPCDGAGNERVDAAAGVGFTGEHVAVDAGAAVTGMVEGELAEDRSLFAGVRLFDLFGRGRVELAGAVTQSSFIDAVTARIAVGARSGWVDGAIYYRPELLAYDGSVDIWLEQRAGVELALAPTPTLDVLVTLEGAAGPDVDAFALLTTAVWRPLP
jgi:hypothetical protein